MDLNSEKLFIIHKGKKIFIHSLAQLKKIQQQTFLKKLKRCVLRHLNLKQ